MRLPVVVVVFGSVLRLFAVRMSRDGTKAESMDNDEAVDDEDGGGGSRNEFCSVEVDSFNGELAVEEAEEDEGVLDSKGSYNGAGFDRSFGKELHGDNEDF